MNEARAAGRRRRWLLVAVVVAVALLVALLVVTILRGPDRTIVGTVSDVESHRLCVRAPDGREAYVIVDSPEHVHGLRTAGCVRMRYSAQGILVAVLREPLAAA